MSRFGILASAIRSLPSKAARVLDAALTSIESSVAGLAADGVFDMTSPVVGKAVYVDAADHVALADADDTAKIPAVGIVASAPTAGTAQVRFSGIVLDAGSFTAGALQYLSATAGALTETPPTAPAATPIALAINTTDLLVFGGSGILSYVLRSVAANLGASLIGIQDSASQITATNVEAALAELAAKFAAGLVPAIAKLQIATGTLVAGEATISTNIVVTASSYVLAMPTANVTGSTNFGCLSNTRASNVAGVAGVGSVLIRALGNDGAKDADAAGAFVAFIIN